MNNDGSINCPDSFKYAWLNYDNRSLYQLIIDANNSQKISITEELIQYHSNRLWSLLSRGCSPLAEVYMNNILKVQLESIVDHMIPNQLCS